MDILKQPKKQSYYVIALLFFLMIALVLWWVRSKNIVSDQKKSVSNEIEQVEVTQVRALPEGMMKLQTDKKSYQVGEKVTLTVVADSAGEAIVGYDVMLSSTDKIKLDSVKSLIPDFTTFRTVGNDLVGAQDLDSKEKAIWKNQPIAELTFTASVAGEVDINLVFEPFSTTNSSLQNDKSLPENILGKVEGVKFTITENSNIKNR